MNDRDVDYEILRVQDALGLLDDPDVIFVDVREDSELAHGGWIPGAVHAPMSQLGQLVNPESSSHLPALSSGKRLLVYCAAGVRSAHVARSLVEAGIANVAHLGDGFGGWLAAGGPVERG